MRLHSLKDVLNFFLHNFPEATSADDLIISVVVLYQMVEIWEKANEKDCFWHSETGISKPNEASGLQMVNCKVAK